MLISDYGIEYFELEVITKDGGIKKYTFHNEQDFLSAAKGCKNDNVRIKEARKISVLTDIDESENDFEDDF